MKVVLYLKEGYGPHGPLSVKTRHADWPHIPNEGQKFFRHLKNGKILGYIVDYVCYDESEDMDFFQASVWATKIEPHEDLSDDYTHRYYVVRVDGGKVSVTSLSKKQLQERLHSDLSGIAWKDSFDHIPDVEAEKFCCIIRGGLISSHGVLQR